MRSQIVGIAWVIALLLFLTGYYFFSSRGGKEGAEGAASLAGQREILTQKEDSVYASRRETHASYREPIRYTPNSLPAEGLYTTAPPPVRKQALQVELNTADSTTLQLLHGIGPAYARRIVRYRERLGGFVADTQLLEVYGFTPALLEHLRPHLALDTTALRRLPINSAELKALARHPYMEYYQARDIVALRSRGVLFRSAEDLRAVPSMADSTLERLLPYLDFATP
ncbi:MAG: helix-hairpin-helix domain-containing protein [Bacteroidales bacterium]|nr:helix-hairpin-helix domain-containing protein [Bacteroidales bacterium]